MTKRFYIWDYWNEKYEIVDTWNIWPNQQILKWWEYEIFKFLELEWKFDIEDFSSWNFII